MVIGRDILRCVSEMLKYLATVTNRRRQRRDALRTFPNLLCLLVTTGTCCECLLGQLHLCPCSCHCLHVGGVWGGGDIGWAQERRRRKEAPQYTIHPPPNTFSLGNIKKNNVTATFTCFLIANLSFDMCSS
jgi:hypothetical protein